MRGMWGEQWGALLCKACRALHLCALVGYSGRSCNMPCWMAGCSARPIHVAWLSITCRPQVMTGGKKKGQRVDQPARGG